MARLRRSRFGGGAGRFRTTTTQVRNVAKVLVVGAGPTGLVLAIQLTRYGVPVRIIDFLPEPSPHSRAIGIQARTLELFERMEVSDAFLDEGLRYREIFVRSDRKLIVHESLSAIRSRFNYVLALGQNRTEAILTERLRALGVEIERGTRVVHFERGTNAVRTHLRGPGGETDVDFAYVVGCDGAQSTVRHLLDLKFAGQTISEAFAVADLRLEGNFPRDAISIYLSRGSAAAVFPLPGEGTRVVLHRQAGFEADPTVEDVRSVLHQGGMEIAKCEDATWLSRFAVVQRRVATMARGRVFLAGDAAHVHSPIGAQGMNTGIQDAENLAWKIALTLRNEAQEDVLESYAVEREAVSATLARMTGALGRNVAAGNPAARAVRDRVAAFATSIPMAGDRFRDAISELAIVYHRSPVVMRYGRTPDPQAGAHAPDGSVALVPNGERTSVFKLLESLRFVLLIFTYRYDPSIHQLRVAAERYGGVVDAYVVAREASLPGANLADPAGAVFRAYGVEGEPQFILIRPDGYVALRAAARDAGLLNAYLDRTLLPASPEA